MHFLCKTFGSFEKTSYLCTRKTTRTTNFGAVVQLVRILACHARGRGFEPRPHRKEENQKWFSFFISKPVCEHPPTPSQTTNKQNMKSQKKFYLEEPIKVNTYDTDYMGIVSNTVYPKYFENLRNAILDKFFPLEEMLKEKNTPILAETHIWYKRPLTLQSKPIGKINITLTGASRWEAEIEISEGERTYCIGHQVGYYYNMESNRPVRFPKDFLDYYESI